MKHVLDRLHSFIFGFTLPLRSLRLILFRPRLVFWSILPIGLTLVLYFFVIRSLVSALQLSVLAHVSAFGLSQGSLGAWIIVWIAKILIFLVAAMTFSFLATLLSTPFNDFLAESAERWVSPPLPEPEIPSEGLFAGYWRNKARLLAIDFMKTLAASSLAIIALLCSWVPVINAGALLLSFLLMTFQFISYPQTRRGEGIGKGVHFLGRHFFASLGFGIVTSLLFSIPIVSCFMLPLAVVGGTLLVGRAGDKNRLY
jgi:CysZ protein